MYRLRLFFYGLIAYRLTEKNFKTDESFFILTIIFFLTFWAVVLGKIFYFQFFYYGLHIFAGLAKIIGLIIIFSGLLISWIINIKLTFKTSNLTDFIGEMLYLNWLFRGFYSFKLKPLRNLSSIDLMWIEMLGPKRINRRLMFFFSITT